ncbi:DUF1540 domain-containing protein [Clostridium aestuarii]|uniref:DUF1540 domain-containing protein n=1 Tax=Clostridium aestuarii TaxID=338193 RepID=A0ABT4CWS8_9CLOT|nr:DUF1540 domain-containing protein [Clostridium aestuarii]MCY6483282.1 DUF1540 domain-containing protein [Clostridium aestuarii]
MNTVLSCSVGKCVHNINGLCSAREINVGGLKANTSSDTQCGTFAEKGLKNAFTNLANMNISGELKQVFAKNSIEMSPKIICNAENCSYNNNRICNAPNVQIKGLRAQMSEQTECETFIQK